MKYNSEWKIEWASRAGLTEISSVAQTPDGGYAAIGYSGGSGTIPAGWTADGVAILVGPGTAIEKHNSEGKIEWIKVIASKSCFSLLEVTDEGEYIVSVDDGTNRRENIEIWLCNNRSRNPRTIRNRSIKL